jgi:hypothetical protein
MEMLLMSGRQRLRLEVLARVNRGTSLGPRLRSDYRPGTALRRRWYSRSMSSRAA